MDEITRLNGEIDRLTSERGTHIAKRSEHDKKQREIEKEIRRLQDKLVNAYKEANANGQGHAAGEPASKTGKR